MEKSSKYKVKLGIFVSVSIVLFIAVIYFIGQRQQLFSSTFRLSSVFKDIGGLQVGNNVRFSGINVGIVESIQQVTDTTVKVDMLVLNSTRKFIKKNAQVLIGSDGLMGSKIISIIPAGAGKQSVVNNDVLVAAQQVSMDEIMMKIKVTADNAADITEYLSDIMENIHDGKGTIGKLFMDTAFAKNIDKTIVNLKQGTGGFKQNMDAVSHNIFLRGYLKRKNRKNNK